MTALCVLRVQPVVAGAPVISVTTCGDVEHDPPHRRLVSDVFQAVALVEAFLQMHVKAPDEVADMARNDQSTP